MLLGRREYMPYYAHRSDDGRWQTITEHLEGTAKLAQEYCIDLLKPMAEKIAKYHDIGKYAKTFQKRLEGASVSFCHAVCGAIAYQEQANQRDVFTPMLTYCIAGHHTGLMDGGTRVDTPEDGTLAGCLKRKEDYTGENDYTTYQEEYLVQPLTVEEEQPALAELLSVRKDPFEVLERYAFFTKLLFSCLTDADFLDTERFCNPDTKRGMQGDFKQALEILNHRFSELPHTTSLQQARSRIQNQAFQNAEHAESIAILDMPTGSGKTLCSLKLALSNAIKHHKKRVIYVIPYTSIIEQNAQVFREILGEENVLENHYNVDYESSEEFKPMQLASENWDKPVVVTTNVQFFESLFANKSSKCRKIHNIANSVVIFDEAQMLPMDYLKPCIAMLQELVDSYSVSIVLCTATQPALDSFFSKNELIKELCPRMEEQFLFFKRVNYQNLGRIREDDLLEKLKKENNALCIVNTKKAAQMIYKELQGEGIYHLSTSMYPKHRKRVLKRIRERLKNNEKCIVISTSLVEAGVDLDFATVYRQIAGLDSMIQAAGRCNREGKRELSESMVYIFDLEESYSVPNQRQQIDVSKGILQDYTDIADLKAIHDYFTRLYHYRGTSLDKKKIMDEFQKMECNFAEVAKEFKLIEENTKTIFINREPEADELLQELRIKGVTRERMRKAGQYCIQIYDNAKSENSFFDRLNGAGMLRPVSEEMQDFYELVDGEQYSEEYGLDFSLEDGMAFFV